VGRVSFNEVPKQLDISQAVKRQGENEIVIMVGDAETLAEALNLTEAKKTFSNGAFRRLMSLGTTRIHAVPDVRVLRTWINYLRCQENAFGKDLHRERFGSACHG
jgi:hypothetical protein